MSEQVTHSPHLNHGDENNKSCPHMCTQGHAVQAQQASGLPHAPAASPRLPPPTASHSHPGHPVTTADPRIHKAMLELLCEPEADRMHKGVKRAVESFVTCCVYSLLRLKMMIFLFAIYIEKKKTSLIQQSSADMGLPAWDTRGESARPFCSFSSWCVHSE